MAAQIKPSLLITLALLGGQQGTYVPLHRLCQLQSQLQHQKVWTLVKKEKRSQGKSVLILHFHN